MFLALVAVELAVPPWAERPRPTTWHPHHIADRYGLFAIILLGEGVLATSLAVDGVLADGGLDASFVTVAVSGLVLVFALWWLYFLQPCGEGLVAHRERSYRWGYGHYGIFVALAALGGGLEVAVQHSAGATAASALAVSYSVALPVAVFLAFQWFVNAAVVSHLVIRPATTAAAVLVTLVLPILAPVAGPAIVIAAIAVTCSAVVVVTLLRPA